MLLKIIKNIYNYKNPLRLLVRGVKLKKCGQITLNEWNPNIYTQFLIDLELNKRGKIKFVAKNNWL